jgi:hypothetical protein
MPLLHCRYDENDPESLGRIHRRVAERFYNVCTKNLGLYVKLGQGYDRLVNFIASSLAHVTL